MHGSDKRATLSQPVIGIHWYKKLTQLHWYSKLTQILKTDVRHFVKNAVCPIPLPNPNPHEI